MLGTVVCDALMRHCLSDELEVQHECKLQCQHTFITKNRPQQEELLRGAAAAGLSAEDQAGLAAGSDSVAVQQQAQGSDGDAVVAGAAGAAAFLAHSTRAALRDVARRDDAS